MNEPSWRNAQECSVARWGLRSRTRPRMPFRSSRAMPQPVRSASATMRFEITWLVAVAHPVEVLASVSLQGGLGGQAQRAHLAVSDPLQVEAPEGAPLPGNLGDEVGGLVGEVELGAALSLDSREAGCARLLCCPGSDDTMKALVTDGSVTLRTADLN